MKVAILSCNLGNFDNSIDPVPQDTGDGIDEVAFHRYTDNDFPPVTGLSPRFQYRIPKMFGFEMFPGYDIYIWLDGGISFKRSDSVKWYVEQLGENDALFFKHPWRQTVAQERDHIEKRLADNDPYITPRYKNGFHKEMAAVYLKAFKDDALYASTVFAYRNTRKVRTALRDWWYWNSRFYTCDQIAQAYIIKKHKLDIIAINENLFKISHVSLVSHHK